MCTQLEMRGVQTLLPCSLMRHIRETKPETEPDLQTLEKQMLIAATLVVNLILDLTNRLRQNKLKELDCNPGDAGCQMRAIILPDLLRSLQVLEELSRLEKIAKEISTILQIRKSTKGSYTALLFEDPPAGFFARHILPRLSFSKEVCYLLDCRMLKITRVFDHIDPNGIVVTKTAIDELSHLSKDFPRLPIEFRNQLVQNAAARISEDSLSFIRSIANRLNMSVLAQHTLTIVRKNRPEGNYKPKSFGCLFYEIQAMLMHLREQKMLLAIKTFVQGRKPHHFFFQAQGPRKEFTLLDDTEVQLLPGKNILVVIDGVIGSSFSNDLFVKKVQEIGLPRLLLTCAAQEAPFEHHSTLEDVADLEARAEIESYIKMAPEIGCIKGQNPLLQPDHIFCSSLQEELATQGKTC